MADSPGSYRDKLQPRSCGKVNRPRRFAQGYWVVDLEHGASSFWHFSEMVSQKSVEELPQIRELCSARFQSRNRAPIILAESPDNFLRARRQPALRHVRFQAELAEQLKFERQDGFGVGLALGQRLEKSAHQLENRRQRRVRFRGLL